MNFPMREVQRSQWIGESVTIDPSAEIGYPVAIGNNCVISPAGKADNVDHELYYIRDGIVIIPKNSIVPHGAWI